MSTSVSISNSTNTVSVQDAANQIAVINNSQEQTVVVPQSVITIVEVSTGPQGNKGDQGPIGPIGPSGSVDTGSFVTTSSFNSFTSSYNTGSFTGSFTGSLFGTATTASFVNLLAGPNITINYQSTGIAITASGGGGSGTPGGSNTQIQYNSASVFAGNSGLTYNYLSQSLQNGFSLTTTGQFSHAEGLRTEANGDYSHAEGEETQANGIGSHAEGAFTQAKNNYSHAGGFRTVAYEDHQTVVGKYNDPTVPDCLFVVGAGIASNDLNNGFSVRHNGSKDAPSITIPVGTDEPTYAVVGTMYYNPMLGLRFYDGSQWFTIGMST